MYKETIPRVSRRRGEATGPFMPSTEARKKGPWDPEFIVFYITSIGYTFITSIGYTFNGGKVKNNH